MKTKLKRLFCLISCLLLLQVASYGQTGKVVINEYMPWPTAGCGATAEFVELLNFGPGPVDIGCYILTTGKYAITIPPNTILKPGQFYVLAGQSVLPGTCANMDSASTGIRANLNWNTSNCTNVPIPTTGDGLMTDGGSGSTPLVLLSPELKVVDAVVRKLPAEGASTITTSSVGGACFARTFHLNNMAINYEELGMQAGRGNSFARTVDGDCVWVKETRQSGNASNSKSGTVSDVSYEFDLINASSCDSVSGRVSIYVKHNDYSRVFPMNYTVSLDLNNNGIFDEHDRYTTYIDDTAPFIDIENLPRGYFRVTVASVSGCYLKNFEFTIMPCTSTLPVTLSYFKYAGEKAGHHQLEWLLQKVENLQSVEVQKAVRSEAFVTDHLIPGNKDATGARLFTHAVLSSSSYRYFRLKVTDKSGKVFYSPVITPNGTSSFYVNKAWPNPASDKLHVQLTGARGKRMTYTVVNVNGTAVKSGTVQTGFGDVQTTLMLSALPNGVYQLQLWEESGEKQPVTFRFVKQ